MLSPADVVLLIGGLFLLQRFSEFCLSLRHRKRSEIKRGAVWWILCKGWTYTSFITLLMAAVMGLLVLFLSWRGFNLGTSVKTLLIVAGVTIFTFIIAEVIVSKILNAQAVDEREFPDFIKARNELCRERGMFIRPRLRIVEFDGEENACAYGWGIFNIAVIAITRELYQKRSYEQLKGIVGHELAHIRCLHTPILTILTILTNGAEFLALRLMSIGLGGKLLWVPLMLSAKVLFPIAAAEISRTFEYMADALGALYSRSITGLSSALSEYELKNRGKDASLSVVEKLTIRHPETSSRVKRLVKLGRA